jgi:hypothetical protein
VGHELVDRLGDLASSPFAVKALAGLAAAEKDAKRANQLAGKAAAAASKTAADASKTAAAASKTSSAYARASDCHDWLTARQKARMAGGLGAPQGPCPAARAALEDAQRQQGGSEGVCPPEPGAPAPPAHEVYEAFLEAQCPWQPAGLLPG